VCTILAAISTGGFRFWRTHGWYLIFTNNGLPTSSSAVSCTPESRLYGRRSNLMTAWGRQLRRSNFGVGNWREHRGSGARNGVITDRHFLRVKQLSASLVGTSFPVHGLRPACWLAGVDNLTSVRVLDGSWRWGLV
jgi:hypothetical protein